jgi:hypothetical protein
MFIVKSSLTAKNAPTKNKVTSLIFFFFFFFYFSFFFFFFLKYINCLSNHISSFSIQIGNLQQLFAQVINNFGNNSKFICWADFINFEA